MWWCAGRGERGLSAASRACTIVRMPNLLDRLNSLPMPSPAQARKIGGDETNFRSVGVTLAEALQRFAGLKPESRVLEIGCGYGRVALPLTQIMDSRGSYEGIDVIREAIDWCRENVAPIHPRFGFNHFDIYNEFYNPGGSGSVSDTALPFDDAAFDLVFLTSVFTHLVPDDVRAYLREIRRVLAPTGALWSTWFMVDDGVGEAVLDGRSAIPIKWADGQGGYFATPDRGTLAVAYDEAVIDRFYADASLTIIEKRRGDWYPRPNAGPNRQDWIGARSSV